MFEKFFGILAAFVFLVRHDNVIFSQRAGDVLVIGNSGVVSGVIFMGDQR